MKRCILSMLLMIMAAAAYPQLGGRLGKVIDKGTKRADIIQVDFSSLDAETRQLYINYIKELVNKNKMLNYSNCPQELEKSLEDIDGSNIIIWKCHTNKGRKKLSKAISRVVPKTRFGTGWNLYLWKKGCGKYPRMFKSIGMYNKDIILKYDHRVNNNKNVDRLTVTVFDKSDNKLAVMYYTGTTLVYWSNKQ
ncbi:MAG: hypothetical protein IKW46_05110 [Bacteroidaceae bacterium]|nr:hypothetical protein [Bacteroidaceae bacterium]